MAKKKVAPVLGGKKHPRFKLVDRITTLAYRLERAVKGYASARSADKVQEMLDKAMLEYLSWAPMQTVAHDKAYREKEREKLAKRRAAAKKREKAAEKKRLAIAKRATKAAAAAATHPYNGTAF